MTWMSKVRVIELEHVCTLLTTRTDQEWLDALNAERKKEQLDKITYEAFEIVMDRLEKEWFDLVCDDSSSFLILTCPVRRRKISRNPTWPCLQRTPLVQSVTTRKERIPMPSFSAMGAT
jgi:hypothetical protein